MESLYDGLTGIGVRRERINYESFGSATALKPEVNPPRPLGSGMIARAGAVRQIGDHRGVVAREGHIARTRDWRRYSAVGPASVEPARPRLSGGLSNISNRH